MSQDIREIVLDTETTGMDPMTGDRLVEIGCIELVNHLPTGRTYHQYINPERDMPAGAFAVHGLSEEFLAGYPVFAEIGADFYAFIDNAKLVIHNAEFDMKFINAELSGLGFPSIPMKNVVDTLAIARRKFPGSPANLDALCRRFGIDNSNRTLHGALLDAELLADVYLELLGGRQHGLTLMTETITQDELIVATTSMDRSGSSRPYRQFPPSDAELAAHEDMLSGMKEPLWKTAK